MQLGVDGVFVGSGIYKSDSPEKRARAIVDAVAHFKDPEKIAKASENLGEAMAGLEISTLGQRLSVRGV
jgi:pyridoxal 5'-phosphate synthase pdxS subunit